MFLKKKDEFTAIKLYSIGKDQGLIDRPALVEAILDVFESMLEEMPKNFDIDGPYGISKGRTVGIDSFKNKLHQKGHEKYYALMGRTENRLGFHALFEANRPNTTYSEIIFWFKKNSYTVPFKELIQRVIDPLSASCAFQFDFVEGFDIFAESKIKKGFFGVSVEVNSATTQWIDQYESGGYRDIFAFNLLSEEQYTEATKKKPRLVGEPINNKYLVANNA
ncbi:hypothetical protein [Rheinheimera baltica]|uniref:Uncharacterized protein n=1 Tax=Rheinheimera baltica TaxID=67576 RepID=A0ABT9I5F7_9GAMM|nr:hypothetical protein [Rheinheimera baltica]MDP5138638.1 hypothetical protein [Rheinheimera baltica]MDP5151739.1 hypothetical protein [Rheinheimera baltica]MDP5189781.1 hypothetical protein [Rheinheimera baltica]